MHHYIALIWNPEQPAAEAEALRLQTLIENTWADTWSRSTASHGLAVYSKAKVEPAMGTYLLRRAAGVIIGRLFDTIHGGEVNISAGAARKVVDTAGRYLLSNYWGNYVAIIVGDKSRTTYVIRDCSGRLPCYYTKHLGVYIFFSSLPDVRSLDLALTVNDDYLAEMILRHPLHLRDSGLNEVREVLAGDCAAILRDGSIKEYSIWNPYDVAANDVIDNYALALSQLRTSAEQAIAAWASVYRRVLLYLSGGLDSAIVLGCLAKLGLSRNVVCINNYTDGTRDDERQYARAAAEMAGATLIEVPRVSEGKTFFEGVNRIPVQPKPDVPNLARMLMIGDVYRVAKEYDCDTVWTGEGGDHLFLQAAYPYGAADYLFQHPLPLRLLGTMYDAALLSRDSIWSVLFKSVRARFVRGPLPEQQEMRPDGIDFLRPSAVPDPKRFRKLPWQDGMRHSPPGKRLQIRDLVDLLNRHRPLVGLESPFEQHPLISQPLIDVSLKIPTYLLQKGGRHRALARVAFADRVPNCILEREDKGNTSDHVRALLRNSAPLLCEALLDGYLVSRGILEREALERVLLHRSTYRTKEMFPLLYCVAAEMWARNWSTAHPRSSYVETFGSTPSASVT